VLEEVLAAAQRGETDPETEAVYRVQTALTLLRLERLADAEAMAAQAVATLSGLVAETNPNRVGAHAVLGLVLLAQGKVDAAERQLAVAHAACEQTLPAAPARIAVALGVLRWDGTLRRRSTAMEKRSPRRWPDRAISAEAQ
jgi:hypothetical protein